VKLPILSILFLVLILAVPRAELEIPRSVFGSGGGDVAGSHVLRSTLGQNSAGISTSSEYALELGFWTQYMLLVTAAEEPSPALPGVFCLGQNHPNPFNPVTEITFGVPERAWVNIQLHGVDGRLLQTLVDAWFLPGNHVVKLDASHLASGIYLYRMRAGAFVETRKLILVK
jgi:hypothetical protein